LTPKEKPVMKALTRTVTTNPADAPQVLPGEFDDTGFPTIWQADVTATLHRLSTIACGSCGQSLFSEASQRGLTDHGTAAPLFLAGDGVNGGVYGDPPALDKLDKNGNLPFQTDFRQVYATVLEG
jgi:hypothetical protein